MRTARNSKKEGLQEAGALATVCGRPWLLTISLASALCIAYLTASFVHWGNAADRMLYASLGMIPIGLAATLIAMSASTTRTDSRSRWAWRLLGGGLGCFFAGDVLWFVYQNIQGTAPFPSVADAGYLAYYPLMFAGLLFLPSGRERRPRNLAMYAVCSAITLLGAGLITYLILLPTIQSSHDDLLAYVLSVGYPVGDLLLLAGVAWVLLRGVSGNRLSIGLLCAGLIVGLAADVQYGYQSIQGTFISGGLPDAAYMVSWTLFAWAGYTQAAWSNTCRPGRLTYKIRQAVSKDEA